MPSSLLSVQAADGTELCVLDGNQKIVQRGYSGLSVSLEHGIYKVQAQVGSTSLEELVVLREDRLLNLTVPIVTAAPLTEAAPECQPFREGARISSRLYQPAAGGGASLFLYVRWDRWRDSRQQSPANGLQLESDDGEVLLDLEKQANVDETRNWAAARINVNPGAYRIGDGSAGGQQQIVVARSKWETQVFLRRVGPESNAAIDADSTTILMKPFTVNVAEEHTPGFDPDDWQAHRVETARLALKHGRQTLSAKSIVELLDGEVTDPIWGLFGGYLLLEGGFSKDRLGNLVSKLRDLLGPDHPDVEGLALAAGMGDDQFVLSTLPMLRRSWLSILVATLDRHEMVPAGSMAEQSADRCLAREPWLLWENPAAEPDRGDDLSQGILRTFAAYVEQREREAAESSRSPAPFVVLLRKLWRLIAASRELNFEKDPGGESGVGKKAQTSIPKNLLSLLPYEERRQLVLALGLPRARLERLIAQYSDQPPTVGAGVMGQ